MECREKCRRFVFRGNYTPGCGFFRDGGHKYLVRSPRKRGVASPPNLRDCALVIQGLGRGLRTQLKIDGLAERVGFEHR